MRGRREARGGGPAGTATKLANRVAWRSHDGVASGGASLAGMSVRTAIGPRSEIRLAASGSVVLRHWQRFCFGWCIGHSSWPVCVQVHVIASAACGVWTSSETGVVVNTATWQHSQTPDSHERWRRKPTRSPYHGEYDFRMLTRREFGRTVGGAYVAAAARLNAQDSRAVLDIADWSYWFYGVERAKLARGTVVDGSQMYVERWIPRDRRHPYPVVLIHGGYGQGSDWLSTPDSSTRSGQEANGWVSAFLEQGYAVHVVDRPGQGRNPYQPFVHGLFDREAPTFEKIAAGLKTDVNDPVVAQTIASMNQPMANNAITQALWKSRGALLLDDIGPAILITHGDGDVFARVTAEARPALVKGTLAVDSMQPSAAWISSRVEPLNAATATANREPLTREPLNLRIAGQGGFWIGVRKKPMPYGTNAQGQMFVQNMVPAERRHRYPVVMVHGGGGQGTHMMGLGRRPGWVHYFVREG